MSNKMNYFHMRGWSDDVRGLEQHPRHGGFPAGNQRGRQPRAPGLDNPRRHKGATGALKENKVCCMEEKYRVIEKNFSYFEEITLVF